MYEYLLEELPIVCKCVVVGDSPVTMLVTAKILITSWEVEPAIPGVSYNGGQNLPEPDYPAEVYIDSYEVEDAVIWINSPECIATNPQPLDSKTAKDLIQTHLDMAVLEEFMYNQLDL